jgi:hypothetical protein
LIQQLPPARLIPGLHEELGMHPSKLSGVIGTRPQESGLRIIAGRGHGGTGRRPRSARGLASGGLR